MSQDEELTGLDLETFLLLLRADLGAWVTLGLAGVGLALLVWSSWGSRRVAPAVPGALAGGPPRVW